VRRLIEPLLELLSEFNQHLLVVQDSKKIVAPRRAGISQKPKEKARKDHISRALSRI
jgi:hypothetical protein